VSTPSRRTAVIGASGFIGRWVALRALERGDTVLLVGRHAAELSAGTSAVSSRVEVAHGDAAAPEAICDALDRFRPSTVLNLAGYGVARAERDPELADLVNHRLPRVLVAWAAGVAGNISFVHVGSALEYGTASGDLHEATVPSPTTLYGISKLAGTRAVSEEARRTGCRAITARLFTVYGAGEHAGRLFPSLVVAARNGSTLPLSDGRQQRDFAYVEDVADGLLRLGDAATVAGEVVNLATGVLRPVRDFVETAARLLALSPRQLEFGAVPQRAEEMAHEPVAIGRLIALLHWHPSASLVDGISRACARLALPVVEDGHDAR